MVVSTIDAGKVTRLGRDQRGRSLAKGWGE
jgi:hypothetical protein